MVQGPGVVFLQNRLKFERFENVETYMEYMTLTCFAASYRPDCVRLPSSHDMAAVATDASASLRLWRLRRAVVLVMVMVLWMGELCAVLGELCAETETRNLYEGLKKAFDKFIYYGYMVTTTVAKEVRPPAPGPVSQCPPPYPDSAAVRVPETVSDGT